MGRTASTNLEKALQMNCNGMPLHDAWKEMSKLEGGATSWGNIMRKWRELQQQQPVPPQPTASPTAKAAGKTPLLHLRLSRR